MDHQPFAGSRYRTTNGDDATDAADAADAADADAAAAGFPELRNRGERQWSR